MDARQQRGQVIAETCRIEKKARNIYLVPSQTRPNARYYVEPTSPCCDCKDFEERGEPCKHIFAVRYVIEREKNLDGSTTVTETLAAVKKKMYPQDWPNYNKAQTNEKRWFLTLLADLCRFVPEPERKNLRGRPIPLRVSLYSACFKVYSGYSARRFTSDLEKAAEAGHIEKAIHFNSVLNVFDTEAATPILYDLITKRASPLREVETEWAVDSTGFCGSRYIQWVDEKWGTPKKEISWTKCHVVSGTRTNVIAAATILDERAGDAPQLPGLVKTTAQTFTVTEVAADKAYASNRNFEAVDAIGGKLYAAFKTGTTGGVGGLFGKM
jgi:hypothetical protein